MVRFSSTPAARAASMRASSSFGNCVFLASLNWPSVSTNYAFPRGERPDFVRCGSSDLRRGVDLRSLVAATPLGEERFSVRAFPLCMSVLMTGWPRPLQASDDVAVEEHPGPWRLLPTLLAVISVAFAWVVIRPAFRSVVCLTTCIAWASSARSRSFSCLVATSTRSLWSSSAAAACASWRFASSLSC